MREVRLLREAAEEAIEAAAHYESEQAGLGAEFEAAINHAMRQLQIEEVLPLSTVTERLTKMGVRRLVMRRFPFSIVVREAGPNIDVIAFAHHSRRPGYWRERLST